MHWNDGLLRSYLLESLEKEERNRIADHLRGCLRCSSRLKTIEERIQLIEPLLGSSALNDEVTDRELAVAWWRLGQRIGSESVRRNGVETTLWRRTPRWVLIVVSTIALAAALLGLPQVRDAIRLVSNAVRHHSPAKRPEQGPTSRSSTSTAGDFESRPRPETSVTTPREGRRVQSGASSGDSFEFSTLVSSPAYLPKNDPSLLDFKTGFEPRTGYRIQGKVSTEEGEPIPGAMISRYGSGYRSRDYWLPTPIHTYVSDDEGQYSISLDSPDYVYLTLSKEGFAQLFDEFDFPGGGILTKDYRLRSSVCAEGSVFDKDGKPIQGAKVDAWASELNWGSPLPMFIPLISATGSSGEYSLRGLPEGAVGIGASTSRHLRNHKIRFLGRGDCTRIDLQLSPARSFSVTVKTPSGQTLPEAVAWEEKGQRLGMSDERGVITFTVDPDAKPFDCWVSSKGRRIARFRLDPKNPPAVIVLEDGKTFRGQVLADSGEPIANATVHLMAAGNEPPYFEVGGTDKSGRFSISSDYPLEAVSVAKVGYQPQQLTFPQTGPTPQEIEIRLKDAEGGGVFGTALDSSGRPANRFAVVLRDPAAAPLSTRYSRNFQNDRGVFYLDDAPVGVYDLEIWSLPFSQTQRGADLKLGKVEIRKGLVYGEVRIQFPPPKSIR